MTFLSSKYRCSRQPSSSPLSLPFPRPTTQDVSTRRSHIVVEQRSTLAKVPSPVPSSVQPTRRASRDDLSFLQTALRSGPAEVLGSVGASGRPTTQRASLDLYTPNIFYADN
ncbi:hypothetical protein PUN28_011016 [Cardiocondyla obscurior]|uniref:Uncharacterized protein n=1 Tax=Cardiocondyla obscurior TaxID=286306 RepID=A0AAW2FLD0_9HYME